MKIGRNAIDGRFTTVKQALKEPKSHIVETLRRPTTLLVNELRNPTTLNKAAAKRSR